MTSWQGALAILVLLHRESCYRNILEKGSTKKKNWRILSHAQKWTPDMLHLQSSCCVANLAIAIFRENSSTLCKKNWKRGAQKHGEFLVLRKNGDIALLNSPCFFDVCIFAQYKEPRVRCVKSAMSPFLRSTRNSRTLNATDSRFWGSRVLLHWK